MKKKKTELLPPQVYLFLQKFLQQEAENGTSSVIQLKSYIEDNKQLKHVLDMYSVMV